MADSEAATKPASPEATSWLLDTWSLEWWAALLVVLLITAVGVIVVVQMAQGKIDLSKLVSEQDGTASMSRLQLLIFTYVIAVGLLVITLRTGGFPQISGELLGLLGISAGSYVGSKIAQKAAETKQTALANKQQSGPVDDSK